ncbi:MAG: hypothetical protein CFH10_02120, partial [Alphaproteobacteria bacterium MarineAlpha4_Bin2]
FSTAGTRDRRNFDMLVSHGVSPGMALLE